MKQWNYSIILIVILYNRITAHAHVRLGILGGIHFSRIELDAVDDSYDIGDDFSGMTLYGVGGIVDFGFTRNLSLCIEPMHLKRGGTPKIPVEGIDLKLISSYLEFPFFLKAGFGRKVKLYFKAGCSIGLLLDSVLELSSGGIGFNYDLKEITEKYHFGLAFGGGLEFPIDVFSFFFECLYTAGISDIFKGGTLAFNAGPFSFEESLNFDEIRLRTRSLQILVGFTFPVGNY